MASRRRSNRLLAKSDSKSVVDEDLDTSLNPSEPNLDSSFGLPLPGPSTQAIIELAALETKIPDIDDIPESQLLLNLSPNPDKSPSKSPENSTPELCEPPNENSEKSPGPKTSFALKRGKNPNRKKKGNVLYVPKKSISSGSTLSKHMVGKANP